MDAALRGETIPEWASRLPERPEPKTRRVAAADVAAQEKRAAEVESIAEEARRRIAEARRKLATAPEFSEEALSPADLRHFRRFVDEQAAAADRIERAAAEERRRLERARREQRRAELAAAARRRELARGFPPEEVAGLSGPERRRLEAELLGFDEAQRHGFRDEHGRFRSPNVAEGEVSARFLRDLERAIGRHKDEMIGGADRHEAWNDRLEAMRETLVQAGIDSAERMADYFELLGLQRHDGYVLFYKY